jgi:CheY-like chemotaxis protein
MHPLPPNAQNDKPYVLIVEDDPAILELLEEIVSELGCRVKTATGSDSALQVVESSVPLFAIVDWRIPGGGISLVAEMQRRFGSNAPSIVMITAYPEAYQACAAAPGVVEVLRKPFNLEELEIVVRRYAMRRSGEMLALSPEMLAAARARKTS